MSTRAYRPRRRIYGANYEIGESYYKKALDGLDNKRGSSASRFSEARENLRDARSMPKVSFAANRFDDDEEEFFKPAPRKPFNFSAYENNDEDTTSALAVKPYYTPKIFLSHELYDDTEEKSNRNIAKLRSEHLISEKREVSTSAVETTVSSATSRMNATKARLADLDAEMLSITEKQSEREKRNTRLRKLLNESDAIDALAINTKNISF